MLLPVLMPSRLDAARTGSEVQAPNGRRVLFSATGWHNPPGLGACTLRSEHCCQCCEFLK